VLPRASRPSLTGRKVPDENVCNVCGALGLSYEVSRTVQSDSPKQQRNTSEVVSALR